MDKPQLLPCPFCGKSDAFVERLDSSSSMVICQGMVDEYSVCMARGPVGIQDDDGEEQPGYAAAVREWNARAQQPESVAVLSWTDPGLRKAIRQAAPHIPGDLLDHLLSVALTAVQCPAGLAEKAVAKQGDAEQGE